MWRSNTTAGTRAVTQQPSFWIRHSGLVFAAKTFLAAVLAFVLAQWLDMPRPYWAMTTVYITSNPLAGATCSKAIYRFFGTLVGATAAVVLVPNLVDAPELLCLAISVWVGLCLYLSLVDGSPRSYVFMLAGYTVALIGFPSVLAPETIFDTAVSRAEEITLGICCATLVSTLVLPRTVNVALLARIDAWLAGAHDLSRKVLKGEGTEQEHQLERMRLSAEALEMESLAAHLDFETADSNRVRGLKLLRQHMLALVPLLASIEDQIGAGTSSGLQPPRALTSSCGRIAAWIDQGAQDLTEADLLRAELEAIHPRLDKDSSWTDLVAAALSLRLRELIDVTRDCRAIYGAMLDGVDPTGMALAFLHKFGDATAPQRDRAVALSAAVGAAISVLTCCAIWICTGWTDGASAALLSAVTASFFAGQDDPVPGVRTFFGVTGLVVVLSFLYTFAVMPRITTIEMLIASLMPAFLFFGYLAARPATARMGGFLAIMLSADLSLDSSYTGNLDQFANANIALLFGIAITGVILGLVRSLGSEALVYRLMRSNQVTLAAVAENTPRKDPAGLLAAALHQLAMLSSWVGTISYDTREEAANLRQLRAAVNIIDLRRAERSLAPGIVRLIEAFLARLAAAGHAGDNGPLPYSLVKTLDATLAATLSEPAANCRNNALMNLVGIRRALFSAAPAYLPPQSDQGRLTA
jgi:uncharacterized membrane protein YccC